MRNDEFEHVGEVQSLLKESYEKRLKHFEEDELLNFSSMLDPNYGTFLYEKNDKKIWEFKLIEKLKEMNQHQVPDKSVLIETKKKTERKRKRAGADEHEDSDDFFDESSLINSSDGPDICTKQVKEYLDEIRRLNYAKKDSERIDVLSFWKLNESKWLHLSQLAKSVLGIPASQSSVECLLSEAGNIYSNKRTCMKMETLEKLLLVKCNLQIL